MNILKKMSTTTNPYLVTGIDIGGSHITVALVDTRTHTIVRNSLIRKSVKSNESAEKILDEWTEAIISCKAPYCQVSDKIGIAMPGPFNYDEGISLIKNLNKYDSLYKLNVKQLLAQKLAIAAENITMMNDASCFLKGEVYSGTAKSCKTVIGLTLGTGLGSALFKDGMVHDTDMYRFPYEGASAEDYLSTRWFIDRYKALTGTVVNGVKEISTQISNNPLILSIFNEFGKNLGGVLLNYIQDYRADTVILGGNIAHAWSLFIPETNKFLTKHSINVSIVKAKLKEEAAIIGASSLCKT